MGSIMRRHGRFLVAFVIGCGIGALARWLELPAVTGLLLGVNSFFVTYLGFMTLHSLRLNPEALRHHAETEDEGIVVIVLLAIGTVSVSLVAIFAALNGSGNRLEIGLAMAAVPLGWATMQVLAAFRYAYLYYAMRPVGGLTFPGKGDPGMAEFMYLSFGNGVALQVADVEVTVRSLRWMVLVHTVGSFFYNTVILALAVNAAVALGS